MRFLRSILFLTMTITLVVMFACGDDDPVGGGGGGGGGCGTTADMSGTWAGTSQETENSCGPLETDSFTVAITQNGDAVNVTTPDGTFTGTVCGSTTTVTGSFDKSGGTATITATLTLSQDGKSLNGSSTWSWTDGTESCTGASTELWIKSGPGPCDPPVDVAGTWTINMQDVQNTCGPLESDQFDVTITQNGSDINVGTPAGSFSGTVCGNIVSWTGSFPEQGGTTTIESMRLVVSPDGQTLNGESTWSWANGSSCGGSNTITGTKGGGGSGDVTGLWEFSETISGSCGPTETIIWDGALEQNGTVLTVDHHWTGSVNGNQVMWSESYSWPDTTVTIDYNLTASQDRNSMGGTSLWTFKSGGVTFCTGNGNVQAVRSPGALATTRDHWMDKRKSIPMVIGRVPLR